MEKSQYIFILRLTRPPTGDTLSDEQETIIEEHVDYLKGLLDDGALILAGPCLDRSFGIVIYEAESDELARNIMENDPSVSKGVMTAELHPFKVALERGA